MFPKIEVILDDKYGILMDDKQIPYIAIELSEEQAKLLSLLKPHIYKCNGQSYFDILDKDEKILDNKAMYMIFIT